MDQYPISSDDCLILLAIKNSRSLREAANLLDCDVSGLQRKVQKIADEQSFLVKVDRKWRLTETGLLLVGWTQETILSQKKLLNSNNVLRIASTSWLSERLLMPETSVLLTRLGKSFEIQYSIPERGFERALIEGDCDFVVVCHPPENPSIAHKQISTEKWTIAVSKTLAEKFFEKQKKIDVTDLLPLPFIRHHDLNPNTILPLDLQTEAKTLVSCDNLIGVRAALKSGLGWSFVPTTLIKEELLSGLILEVQSNEKMDRKVCLWWLRSSAQAKKNSSLMSKWVLDACS